MVSVTQRLPNHTDSQERNESLCNLIDFYRNKLGVFSSAYTLEHLKEKKARVPQAPG